MGCSHGCAAMRNWGSGRRREKLLAIVLDTLERFCSWLLSETKEGEHERKAQFVREMFVCLLISCRCIAKGTADAIASSSSLLYHMHPFWMSSCERNESRAKRSRCRSRALHIVGTPSCCVSLRLICLCWSNFDRLVGGLCKGCRVLHTSWLLETPAKSWTVQTDYK